MRCWVLAGLAAMAAVGPVAAFDFDRASFAEVVNARLSSMGAPTRVYLLDCRPHEGEFCAFQAGKDLTLDIHSPRAAAPPDYVGLVWHRSPTTREAFAQSTVALVTLCSPNSPVADREAALRKMFADIDTQDVPSRSVSLDGRTFTVNMTADRVILNVADAAP